MLRTVSVILLVIFSVISHAKTSPVFTYTLGNGLKILVKEDHRAPIAIIQVWYKVGSSYELTGMTGLSHALEHMMFRGTKKYGHGMIHSLVIENGGNHNAFTSQDFTCYYEIVPSIKLPIMFNLEADRMRGLLLDGKGFSEEMQVVMEERKMMIEDSPDNQVVERFMAAAYASNPYRTPVIGWMHDIQNLSVTDLKNWYQSWYAPNNAILVVVGDVVPEQVLRMAKKYFGKLPPAKLPEVKPQQEVPTLGKRNIVINIPAKVPVIFMGYNVPSLKTVDQKWQAYALEIIKAILSSDDSSRLPKELERQQQIAATVGAFYDLYSRLDNLFVFFAKPTAKHTTQDLEKALLNEVKKLQTTLVSEKELQGVKNQMVANEIYKRDSIVAQASEIGSLEAVGLPWQTANNYIENIKAITPQQIKAVAKEYFTTDRLTVAELQPIKN